MEADLSDLTITKLRNYSKLLKEEIRNAQTVYIRYHEAIGNAFVKVRYGKSGLFIGRGVSTDVIEATAKAYVNALSKIKAAS